MLARILEAEGLATVSLSLVREHTAMIKPPRALYVPFPFGMPLGPAGDAQRHRDVLSAAFDLLGATDLPTLADLDGGPGWDGGPASPAQASGIEWQPTETDVAAEVTRMRHFHEQWVARHGRTSVGLAGIAPQRLRGVVRFLEAYARGEDADLPARPADVALPYFVRHCVDDLKALYAEARFVMRPDDGDMAGGAFWHWFWGTTALSGLIRQIRERMQASDDPLTKSSAYGIAR